MLINQIKVAAVIVAFDRDDFLKRSLDYTFNQTRKCDLIIVVDNANLASTRKIVEDIGATYISGALENGSAGGFALGMKQALDNGFDYIWTLDDDGYPDGQCLQYLLEFTRSHNLDVSSPLSLSQEDSSQTANPYLFGVRKVTKVSAIQKKEIWLGKVQFYNGMLMSKKMLKIIGLPKKELFLRGDEMDLYYRAKKTGLKMGLVTRALFHHPSGAPEFANSRNSILGKSLSEEEALRGFLRPAPLRIFCLISSNRFWPVSLSPLPRSETVDASITCSPFESSAGMSSLLPSPGPAILPPVRAFR
jgi:rhamnopyranosyl-N-acetylglucosaminyl-diphospho-decaprenol beta-1,3/1,4-galactofuranosyltransferase